MNKIRIITTYGCVACEIAKNLVSQAIQESGKNIELEVINHLDDNCKDFVKDYAISDYPAIIFMHYDTPLSIHIGTFPVPQILKIINTWS